MKLSQIYRGRRLINEGHFDIAATMAIDTVLRQGKVTDTFQYIAIARMLEFVKCGYLYNAGNFWEVTVSIPKVILDTLKATESSKLISIVKHLKEVMDAKDLEICMSYCNKEQSINDWLNYVYSREVNE